MINLADIPEKRKANAERWIKIVSGQSKSGLSVKHYCQEQKVNPSTFYYWFNYLNGKTDAPSSTIHKNKRKQNNKDSVQKLIALKVASPKEIIKGSSKQEALGVLHFPNGLFLNIYDANILPMLLRGFI